QNYPSPPPNLMARPSKPPSGTHFWLRESKRCLGGVSLPRCVAMETQALRWKGKDLSPYVAFLFSAVVSRVPESLLSEPCCPDGWVGYRGKCYYFSEGEGNWESSQSHCSSLGASLAAIDTPQDLAFLMRYKGRTYHWIGLRREESQPWKWVDGTEFNNMFEVKGGGSCAYLNDVAVISSRCQTEKNWVCSKASPHLKKD
uniref:C-type lectin domain-containing protein n=1 Tax=Terrapene triunguis TaxID=2587831 RepID=A0A674JQ56_9SAUR